MDFIGQKLSGYCDGYFSGDSGEGNREIIAFGEDWTVTRALTPWKIGEVEFAPVHPAVLIEADKQNMRGF